MTVEFNDRLEIEDTSHTTVLVAHKHAAQQTAVASSSKVETKAKLVRMETEKAKSQAELAKQKAAATLEAQRALRRTSLLKRNSST